MTTFNLIEIIKIIIMGIIEGITEWLPVSSTGHMMLADEFLKMAMTPEFKDMFLVVIQLGAILAVVYVYWSDMWPFYMKEGQFKISTKKWNLWMKVIVAVIPSIIIGMPLNNFFDAHMNFPWVIALMLIIYGIAFIVIENWNKGRHSNVLTIQDITWKIAIMIGLFQVLSVIPGTSRSGATIVGALLIGVSRVAAAEFTFYLAVPTMFGASLLKLVKFGLNYTFFDVVALLLGMVVAYFVSILVIRFLMSYIRKHDFRVFGWYRIAVGLLFLVLIVAGVI
jgi:undecaprenyl-diphosphatase